MPRICPILFSIVLPIAIYYPWPWTIGWIVTLCCHVCFFLFPCLVCGFSFYVKRNTSRIWFPMWICHLASMGNPVLERRCWKDCYIFFKNPFLINEFSIPRVFHFSSHHSSLWIFKTSNKRTNITLKMLKGIYPGYCYKCEYAILPVWEIPFSRKHDPMIVISRNFPVLAHSFWSNYSP